MPTNFPRVLGGNRNDSSPTIALSFNGKLLHKDIKELDIRGENIDVAATNDGAIIKFPEYVDSLQTLNDSISAMNADFNDNISTLQSEVVSVFASLSATNANNTDSINSQIVSMSALNQSKLAEIQTQAQELSEKLSNSIQSAIDAVVIPDDSPALQQIQGVLDAIQAKPERYDEILECIDETKRLITGIDIPEADLMPLNAKLKTISDEIEKSKKILEDKLDELKAVLFEEFGIVCLSVKSQFEEAFNELIKAQDQHSNAMREDVSLLAAQHNAISALLEQNQKIDNELITNSIFDMKDEITNSISNIEKSILSIERKVIISIISKANKLHKLMKRIFGWTIVLLLPIATYCSVQLIRLFCR